MQRANVFDGGFEVEPAPAGYACGVVHLTRALGAERLAVKAFELPSGNSVCPYHYEYEEEWLLVLEGEVAVRVPAGEEHLRRGDVVAFPAGPAGAHKVTNRGERPALLVMFSSAREPAVAVYPDSDKIGVWPGNEHDKLLFHRADGRVDYWDGEQ